MYPQKKLNPLLGVRVSPTLMKLLKEIAKERDLTLSKFIRGEVLIRGLIEMKYIDKAFASLQGWTTTNQLDLEVPAGVKESLVDDLLMRKRKEPPAKELTKKTFLKMALAMMPLPMYDEETLRKMPRRRLRLILVRLGLPTGLSTKKGRAVQRILEVQAKGSRVTPG